MIALHLPALQVVLPLLAAPLCAIFRRGILAWLITLFASWAAFAAAIAMAYGFTVGIATGNGAFIISSLPAVVWATPVLISYCFFWFFLSAHSFQNFPDSYIVEK